MTINSFMAVMIRQNCYGVQSKIRLLDDKIQGATKWVCTLRSFPRPESMKTAFGMASQSLIAATDYLEALDFLVQKEEFAIAPWSCARGMVESSALCSWWALPPESVSAEVYLLDMSHSVNNKKWQDMMVIP